MWDHPLVKNDLWKEQRYVERDVALFEMDLSSHLQEAEKRIKAIFIRETLGQDGKESMRMAQTVFIYRHIAFYHSEVDSAIKITMKHIAIQMLINMINDQIFDPDEIQSYIKDHNVTIDLSKYICDNCTSLGAIYQCAKCKQAKYCHKSCQIVCWKKHKVQCILFTGSATKHRKEVQEICQILVQVKQENQNDPLLLQMVEDLEKSYQQVSFHTSKSLLLDLMSLKEKHTDISTHLIKKREGWDDFLKKMMKLRLQIMPFPLSR